MTSFAVIGPGALGTALGRVLERGGAVVQYVGRGERVREEGPLDFALVTVKAYDTEAAIRASAAGLRRARGVISLQNGLGNVETIARVLGKDAPDLSTGLTTHAARRRADGTVEHVAAGETVVNLRAAAEAMTRHGLPTRYEAGDLAWRKLPLSCGINALTALEGVPNGGLLARPAALERAIAAAREAADVGRWVGCGAPSPDEVPRLLREVCERTAANRSSMLQDLEAGRRTEVDEINGAIVRIAWEHGREAPLNAALAREITERTRAHIHA